MDRGADDEYGVAQTMYGVLYAISAEIFPAKDRGTGNGLTATATGLFAILVRVNLLHVLLLGSRFTFSEISNLMINLTSLHSHRLSHCMQTLRLQSPYTSAGA